MTTLRLSLNNLKYWIASVVLLILPFSASADIWDSKGLENLFYIFICYVASLFIGLVLLVVYRKKTMLSGVSWVGFIYFTLLTFLVVSFGFMDSMAIIMFFGFIVTTAFLAIMYIFDIVYAKQEKEKKMSVPFIIGGVLFAIYMAVQFRYFRLF